MGVLSNFRLISRGVEGLLKSNGVRAFVTERANTVLAAAQSGAPLDTGAYRSSLHIIQDTTDRVAVRVASDVEYAMAVEAATGNLARALDASSGGIQKILYTTKSGKQIWATPAQVANWTRGSGGGGS